jgi:hypothetical protein
MSESLAAVVAHGLLNSLAVVKDGVATLWETWDGLSVEQRAGLAEGVLAQAEVMADGLDSLPDVSRHRLGNHLFVLRGACQTMLRDGRFLTKADRDELLTVVNRQADYATGVLEAVVQSLPDEVLVVLNRLGPGRERDGADSQARC